MNNNTNVNNNNNGLLSKAVAVDPIGVIYSLTSSEVESFVYDLFKKQGINDVFVKCSVAGNEKRPEVMVGVFINKHSKCIRTSNNNRDVADFLKRQMDSGLYYPDQQLTALLKPMTKEVKLHLQGNQVVCLLDIFKVLGLMLLAKPGKHQLNITEAKRIKGESVMIVWKTLRSNGSFESDNDSASKTLAKLSRKW